jgi:putative Mg2+ transporter-C (MgtC) family protein
MSPAKSISTMSMELEQNILLRAFVALVLSGILGWEREAAGKSAGVRTHMLIGLASALFVALAELLVSHFQARGEQLRFDPIRVLEAVVTGISFLGTGTIFVAGNAERVKGLTTAAAILVTAAVGMMVGLQLYVLASGITLMTFLVLHALSRLKDKISPAHADAPEP